MWSSFSFYVYILKEVDNLILIIIFSNGAFYLIGLPQGPVEIKNIIGFLQSQKTFKASMLSGRYTVDLMLEFAARHGIKPAIVKYPLVKKIFIIILEKGQGKKRFYQIVWV